LVGLVDPARKTEGVVDIEVVKRHGRSLDTQRSREIVGACSGGVQVVRYADGVEEVGRGVEGEAIELRKTFRK
jgi:hypothetical protein